LYRHRLDPKRRGFAHQANGYAGRSDLSRIERVLVTGGAGYVGAVLVPKLLDAGYAVKVLDLFIFGGQVLDQVADHPDLELVQGDMRDRTLLEEHIQNCDALIHLACVSNDPSFDLDPQLGKSINFDAFLTLVDVAKRSPLRRFVFASSSSVYGIKSEPNVTEDLPLAPLTDYSKYKAMCEQVLLDQTAVDYSTLIVRPATVSGYSPRMRLDLTVNILTAHAVNNGEIKVFGGEQMRPNIHIEDITDLYVQSLEWPADAIDRQIFNVGCENFRVAKIAEAVESVVEQPVSIVTTPTNDQRSYHICSDKIRRGLGFEPKRTMQDAVQDMVDAFKLGKIPDAMTDSRFYNVETMKQLRLQ